MNITIVGAGAMGSRFGSALFNGGYEVSLLDTWKKHIEEINRNQLKIENEKGTMNVPIHASLPEENKQKADLIIIFTKSTATEEMIKRCLHLVTRETKVLTLQNGIGNIEILSKYIPKKQLFAGTTTYTANLKEPGYVAAYGSGDIEIMHVDGERLDEAKKIVSLFNDSGLRTTLSSNVIKSIWEKTAFNSVLNTLCTLTSSTVRIVGSYDSIEVIINGVLNEIELVANAELVQFDKQKVKDTINGVFDPTMSGNHYSSMYHDIQNGRKTEIEYLNGAIIQKAKKFNIPVQYNTLLFHLIKMLENRNCRVSNNSQPISWN